MVLPRGAATNVYLEVSKEGAPEEAGLFCCQLHWFEKPSPLYRLGRKIDQPIYWLASFIGTEWKPPWGDKRFAVGEAFASNVRVADYFSRVYGFTRAQWLEEQQLAQKASQELARRQAAMPPGTRIAYASPPGWPLTAEQRVAKDARSAFVVFCQTATNVTGSVAPGARPTGGRAPPPPDSAGSGAGRQP